MLASDEVRQLDTAQEVLADQVIRTDGIAQIGVGAAEGDGGNGTLDRGVQVQPGVGVQALYFGAGQVVVDHGQVEIVEPVVTVARLARRGDDHRLVGGVGEAEHQLRVGDLEGVGTAEQVDLPSMQGGNRFATRRVTQDLDTYPEFVAQKAGVVGGQAFVVVFADVDVKRRIVGSRDAQAQHLFACQPLPVSAVQRRKALAA
ncbi:hypothetical protein D3C80_922540 [compost metagenome]